MSEPLQKKPRPSISSKMPPAMDVLPDQLFSRMRRMLTGALHNLPTPLVLILIASLLVTVLTGLSVKFMVRTPSDPFMPQRVSADASRPNLDPVAIEGNWTAIINGKAMTLRMEKQTFEWVVKSDNNDFDRVFARGNFRTVGNVLILGQRQDLGRPLSTLEQGMLTFLPMGLQNLNVKAEENGRLMVWILPSSERRRLSPDIRKFFPTDDGKPLTWVRM
jgi:hypothetical protein